MAIKFSAKIDISKIDKAKTFKGRNGAEYLDVAFFENRDGTSQYGDSGYIVQSLPKADRDAGQRGAIIGNWRYPGQGGQAPAAAAPKAEAAPEGDAPPDTDSVPF